MAGAEWGRLTTNLVEALTPAAPGHGIYYQGFLADRLLYRDAQGAPALPFWTSRPMDVIIDRHLSIEETLAILARRVEQDLVRQHPGDSLFLLLAPNARRYPQPLLLDRQRRQCIWLSPATLYDTTERGVGLSTASPGPQRAGGGKPRAGAAQEPHFQRGPPRRSGRRVGRQVPAAAVPQTQHPLSPAGPSPRHGPRAVGGVDGPLHRHAAGGRLPRPLD